MSYNSPLKKDMNYWNRKIHIYIGLFLMFFICFFAYSGLLLNHGSWGISSFWEQREILKTVTKIQIPATRNSNELVKNIMSQLNTEGEVTNVKMWMDSIHFRVSIPGNERDLSVNFNNGTCIQTQLKYNLAGIIRTLHTFNGVDRNDAASKPNWLITNIWRISMDGIAIGLILLCVSSWIMWFKVRQKFAWSLPVLAAGLGISVYFVFVLGML